MGLVGAEDEPRDFTKALGAGGNFIALDGDAGGKPGCVLANLQPVAYGDEFEGGLLSAIADADDGAAGKRNGDEG